MNVIENKFEYNFDDYEQYIDERVDSQGDIEKEEECENLPTQGTSDKREPNTDCISTDMREETKTNNADDDNKT